MEIEIRQLDWNPFRNVKEYPINKDKVNGLVRSIRQTSFWDNVLARPSPTEAKRFELAYGHHRLMALHKIYRPNSKHKIDIPVRKLDDATMLKIMANENAAAWSMETAVVIETIKATEQFLTGKELTTRQGSISPKVITDFLGGVFTEAIVVDALSMIRAVEKKEVDIKALKIIDAPTKAATFMRAVNSLPEDKKPTPEKQREIASNIVKHETPRHRIKETVEFASGVFGEPHLIKAIPTIDEFVWQHRAEVDRVTKYINALADEKESIPNKREWQSFRAACALLLTALNRLFGDEQQKGARTDGEKKERRAVEQRQARALLTK